MITCGLARACSWPGGLGWCPAWAENQDGRREGCTRGLGAGNLLVFQPSLQRGPFPRLIIVIGGGFHSQHQPSACGPLACWVEAGAEAPGLGEGVFLVWGTTEPAVEAHRGEQPCPGRCCSWSA